MTVYKALSFHVGVLIITIFFVGGTVYGQDDWDVLDFLPAILAGRASSIPGEAPAQGNYRALSHSIGSEVDAVAISNRGWRAVAGAVNGNIYLFSRSQTAPLFSYTTGDQIRHVDISRNGCAFVAGGLDGKIYYFECDKSTPAWTCDTGQDDTSGSSTVEGVSISQDGRWIAAVSKLDAYLFRRDKSTPVLKVRLSTYQGANDTLSTVALSADGSRFAVGTALGNTGARVYYLDQTGVIWSYFIAGVNCGINYKPTPVAISAKGELIAAGGCDGRLYVWNSTSSTPRWSHMMPNTCAPTSIAISDDGTKMAVACDNKLYFVDGTTNAPDFTNDQSDWEWDGWVSSYTQPSVYTGHDNVPGETWLGVSGSQGHVRISADGNYVSAAAYVYGYAYNFYKGINEPFRVVHLSNTSEAVGALDLSPDGSWIVFAGMGSYSGEVVRIEVAPAEFIRVEFPLTFRASNETLNELVEIVGGDKFKVDYVIVKPGRAANLTQEWAMWAAPLAGSVLIPPNQILCSGTMEWSWNHNLADGNQIVTGTRELEPPQCIQGNVTTIDYFFLVDELADIPSNKKLSDDNAILATVQIGAGN